MTHPGTLKVERPTPGVGRIVHRVVAREELDRAMLGGIGLLLAASANAQREIKQLFGQLHVGPVEETIRELIAQTLARVRGTDDAREGFASFGVKRLANRTPR